MINITKKEEDFKIYVENEKKNYISSSNVLECEKSIYKKIYFTIKLDDKTQWEVALTREEIKSLAELTYEAAKYL